MSALFAVAPEGRNEWLNPGLADEGHHQIDAVGGVDLRRKLIPQDRLARRIGEERGIQQRDERLGDLGGPAIWESTHDRMKDARRVDWCLRRIDACEGGQLLEYRLGDLEALPHAFGVA